jgi:hypothetical protein
MKKVAMAVAHDSGMILQRDFVKGKLAINNFDGEILFAENSPDDDNHYCYYCWRRGL